MIHFMVLLPGGKTDSFQHVCSLLERKEKQPRPLLHALKENDLWANALQPFTLQLA